ncbi:DUF4147 domain-containing protein [Candidatus Micrarchaeota archaeon]|nr:DUF4147 domain-containing protein [Candidatus Micrarchaeota archaeon]
MGGKILNLKELLGVDDACEQEARELVLSAFEAVLEAADAGKAVEKIVEVEKGGRVSGGQESEHEGVVKIAGVDLDCFENVFVVGAGKASGAMAEALEEKIGERISVGAVNVFFENAGEFETKKIKIQPASHPEPDARSVEGTKRIVEIMEKAGERDLVVCLFSGGGSAMLELPREGVTLADVQQVTRELNKRGASISELNAVRKHLSRVKGGLLAKNCKAEIVSLLVSDVVGDDLRVIASGPTAPDATTFNDAGNVLKKYLLWEEVGMKRVRGIVERGVAGGSLETVKQGDACFSRVKNIVIAGNSIALKAAAGELKEFAPAVVENVKGDAREVGRELARVLKEKKCVIAGGETTVKVNGSGKGGRNQELALRVARELNGEKAVVFSAGTDGIDGNSPAAGAIVSEKTVEGRREVERALEENDSYTFLKRKKSVVVTGATGTNVNDVFIALKY